jgi:hypothetical protein
MQEVGLKKGYFSESKVGKLSKEPQATIKRIVWKGSLWTTCGHQKA